MNECRGQRVIYLTAKVRIVKRGYPETVDSNARSQEFDLLSVRNTRYYMNPSQIPTVPELLYNSMRKYSVIAAILVSNSKGIV